MRPFFSYYGSKYRIAKKYPNPKHDTIIEPFAGSACFSLRYYNRKIILNDLNPVIYGIWDFLIKSSSKDILDLPILEIGQNVDDLKICQEAKHLIGFNLDKGNSHPSKTLSKWAKDPRYKNQFWSENKKRMIASQVNFIKHWQITNKSYEQLENHNGYWFIDPPYQEKGYAYPHNKIDYAHLSIWAKNRNGTVIVCKGDNANWLPFEFLVEAKANIQTGHNVEKLFCINAHQQKTLF